MKTRLKIYSLLLMVVFTAALGYEMYKGSGSFSQGFNEGYHHRDPDHFTQKIGERHSMTLLLDTDNFMPKDSILNKRTGQYCPAEYHEIIVYANEKEPWWAEIRTLLFGFLSLISFVVILICFYRIITAIQSAKFFEQSTILKLRLMGISFFVLALMYGIDQYYMFQRTQVFFEFDNYKLASGEWFLSSYWIYGLISFVIAESFSIGLKMKEEQDLTI